ncbi:ATP-binding cassette domain-containing protein [Kitasatospora paracochleata]|uniref:ABC-2 type transport system ATP-binding protein n=1 Tax=Kitasatospora paracochleata TaxID=58354 RepID=A0ABT1J0I2_9ACTN|nr:ATP-binding cassette domain-containing protein [Kitasatospora paracochleata]MCP2310648.1 ABC-2 type transport system ATP-binding protein [Kitasatospora paracochleata]
MIRIAELTKHYGGTVAVDQLSFDVLPHRVTGFLGPNGAGKSTTLRLVVGLDKPTAGTATVAGRPYRSLRHPLHQVGVLLDATALPAGRSGLQHLAALARSNRIARSRAAALLEEVGLGPAAHRRVGGYSLGMKQRLGIAAALLGDPPVLIFDEPINGLDPEGIRWIRELFGRLAAEGRTVLVSSHVMSEMEHTADHLIVIGKGRLIADTAMADLTSSAAGRSVLVRSPRAEELGRALTAAGGTVRSGVGEVVEVAGLTAARIGDLALDSGIPVHELTPRATTLEEAFMQLTTGQDGAMPDEPTSYPERTHSQ